MDPRGRSRGQQELVAAPALGRAGGRAASQGACAGARVGATPPAHPRTRSPHHPWHCRLHGAAWGQNGPLLSTWGCALSIFLSACSLLCLARLLATLSPPCHSSAGRGLLPWDLLQRPAPSAAPAASFKPSQVKAESFSTLILDEEGSPDDRLIHLPPHKATSILPPTSPCPCSPSPLSVRPSGISPSPTRGPDLQTPPWSWRWQAASDELCVLQNVFAVCICDDTWQASVRVVCFWGMFVYCWGGVYI